MLINSKPILRQEHISVTQENDIVILTIGNASVSMPYRTAFQISAWMRLRARQAKRFAGDDSRQMTVIGSLSDLGDQ